MHRLLAHMSFGGSCINISSSLSTSILIRHTPADLFNMSASNSLDYEAIRNTISLYCIALDTKNFDLLDEVFTVDVETVYPFGGKRTGVKDIKDAIHKRYGWTCLINTAYCSAPRPR